MAKKAKKEILWKDRKRNALGLPWSFTCYALDEGRLYITTGVLNKEESEVRLYRITDLTLTRSFWQRITGTGTIHVNSADQSMRNFDIRNIKHARDTKELLSETVEKCRREARVFAREDMSAFPGGPDEHHGPDMDGFFGGPEYDDDDRDDA